MSQGLFITFEGGEGGGKSTQARILVERLRDLGQEVLQTREPGGSPGAEALRGLLLEGEADRWSPLSETLLMYAARRDHLERTITPALRADMRVAAVYATDVARQCAEWAHLVAGTSSIREGSRLERAFRDMYTGTQHAFISEKVAIDAAQVWLGIVDDQFGL